MSNTTEADNTDKKKVSRYQFYFETPLYELVKNDDLANVIHSGEVDAYSTAYRSPTTYSISFSDVAESYHHEYVGYKRVALKNKRKSDDILIFFLIQFNQGFMKIGQFPSLADLQFTEITEKYSRILDDENLKLFKKAVGLAAHGVGAGSFVYLRRIFESLIKDAYTKHAASLTVSEKDFMNLRMTEKVEHLSAYLPSQLVAMKSVYGILSLGVHELTEEECLAYFTALKLSIELILDERLEDMVRETREQKVKAELQNIQNALKART